MRYSDLRPKQQRLVDLMSELQFGTIHGLAVSDGDPAFVPAPLIVRELRLGTDHDLGREVRGRDFGVKASVAQLFALFNDLGSGTIERLDIRHGLPHRVWVREVNHA